MSYFAVLDSDEENEVVAIKVAAPKKEKATKKEAETNQVASGSAIIATNNSKQSNDSNKTNSDKPKKSKDNAGGEKNPNGSGNSKKENTAPLTQAKNAPTATAEVRATDPDEGVKSDRPPRRDHGNHRHGAPGRGRGRGEGRGGDRPRNSEGGGDGEERHPRKREFDRRSSTGRLGEQRKDSRGPHSFGSVKQEAADAEKDPSTAEPPMDPIDTSEIKNDWGENADVPTGDAAVEEVAPAASVPEEPKVYTYEEYLQKKKEQSATTNELFTTTKSIRVVEASEFEGLKTKEAEETVFIAAAGPANKAGKASKKAPIASKASKTAAPLEIAFKVAPTEETPGDYDRPPRNFKGVGGRGIRDAGRGDIRGDKVSAREASGSKVDVFDSSAFPSL